jgi:proline iminopeptidase
MKNIIIFLISIALFSSCSQKTKITYTESGSKEINGTKLYYKIIGKGEPVLIIHGGPGLSHDYFLPGLISLRDKYKLIFYDQRASGKSNLNISPESITLENFVKDIDELRGAFGIKKLNLMAHSWGGMLAMKYASLYPDNIKSLILVNSVGASSEIATLSNIEIAKRFTKEDSIQRSQILNSEEFQKRSSKAIESLMKIGFKHQFYNKTYLDSLNLSLDENYKTNSQLLQNLAKDLKNFDFHSDLETIKCPALLIYGDYDPLTQLAAAKIHESIHNSELIVLDNCGHFPFIEKQNEFNEVLTNFMKLNKKR